MSSTPQPPFRDSRPDETPHEPELQEPNSNEYGQSAPYSQANPYGQAGPYGQPGPYAPFDPYSQQPVYGQFDPYAQPGPYAPPGEYGQPGPYGYAGAYPPPPYWAYEPERPRAEVPSKRPWPAPGHSRLHASDRPRRRRWWTPLLTSLMGIGTYIVPVFVVSIAIGVYIAASGGNLDSLDTIFGEAINARDPWFYIVNFGILALMIPFLWLALRTVEGVGIGALSSTEGRLRWGILGRALGVAAIALSPSIISGIIEVATGDGIPSDALPGVLMSLLVILILVPFQCAAEEYVFRGFALRTLMGWGLAPILAVLIAVVPFTLGHAYGWKGLLDVTVFGLAVGWLAVRTGGLEASIALHVVNNLNATIFAVLTDANPLDDSDIPLWALGLSIAMTLAYTLAVDFLWGKLRKRGASTSGDLGDEGAAA